MHVLGIEQNLIVLYLQHQEDTIKADEQEESKDDKSQDSDEEELHSEMITDMINDKATAIDLF